MASKCNLIVDSCCELGEDYCRENDLAVLNFSYTETGKADGGLHGIDDMFEKVSAHDFYEAMRHGAAPMTSQPSQLEFENAFNAALDSGVPTVYLAFSSGISGCYQGACAALDRVRESHKSDVPLYVVDLRIGSTTQSLFTAEAVRQRDKGLTAEEMVAWAEEARYFVHTMFMVDDLDALRRGGRIPAGVAVVGAKLDVKPLLTFDLDGKLAMAGIARGRKKGIRRMAEYYEKTHNTDMCSAIAAIGNADCPHDAERLIDLIKRSDENTMFLQSNIGPTIGCHVGANMVSCCFWGPDRRESASVSDRIANKVRSN